MWDREEHALGIRYAHQVGEGTARARVNFTTAPGDASRTSITLAARDLERNDNIVSEKVS